MPLCVSIFSIIFQSCSVTNFHILNYLFCVRMENFSDTPKELKFLLKFPSALQIFIFACLVFFFYRVVAMFINIYSMLWERGDNFEHGVDAFVARLIFGHLFLWDLGNYLENDLDEFDERLAGGA